MSNPDPEDALAEATGQARLVALAEYSTEATVLIDSDGFIQWASPSMVDVLGYDVDALVGLRLRDLLSPEDLASWQTLIARVRETPGIAMTGRHHCRHEDGSWRALEGSVRNLLGDPRVGAIMVSCHDVTLQELREAAQHDRDARYRRLVTDATDIIMETDEEGYLQFVNPAGLRLMGFTSDQVIDRRFTEFIREDYRPAIVAHYVRQIERREPSSYIELPVVAADGRELWLGQNAWLTFEQGAYRGFQAVARDITDRMRLEEQLLQAQKMEAVGRLAGGIAHDFNNLLAAIRGNAELLLHLTRRDASVKAELEAIVQSADRAATLTRQLLAFSRNHPVVLMPLDLNATVEAADRLMRRHVGATIDLTLALAPSLPHVMADRVHVEQVLLNLVGNARDALEGGGRIAISTVNVVLVAGHAETTRTGLPPGHYVSLEVADNGGGMDEATQARLFEPFFTTKEPGRGTGLGLAAVYGLVRQMAGAITVSSRHGRGTTFRIYLPAADAARRIEAGPPS
jgi:two-component system, cell cycle sensor histidine kinase and response regulator CckA